MYVVPAPQQQQQPRAMTSYPPPQVMAQVQPQIQQNQQAPHQQPQQMGADYSSAPEKPAKPYDLYFKQMVLQLNALSISSSAIEGTQFMLVGFQAL